MLTGISNASESNKLSRSLIIESPKRKSHRQSGWNDFFPYYAGFPEAFARTLIQSADIPTGGVIFDPWNGSGTTTYAATQLGYSSIGLDINLVMALIAKSRNLQTSEADSIIPQAKSLIKNLARLKRNIEPKDPLRQWFASETASDIRNLERRIRTRLISDAALIDNCLDLVSCFAATFYVALFTTCRNLTKRFKSSNPTWLRVAPNEQSKIGISTSEFTGAFLLQAENMARELMTNPASTNPPPRAVIELGNTTEFNQRDFADFVLTSPPYCTRIDYTAATRVELAVISPLSSTSRDELSREMIGSIKVPYNKIEPQKEWGETCLAFLEKLTSHGSKASSGYYYKTHLDYFDKMSRSMINIKNSLKTKATAVFVVQDSYYKDIHNDVPRIISEMAGNSGLELTRREDFLSNNPFSGINPKSKKYRINSTATESVLCLINK